MANPEQSSKYLCCGMSIHGTIKIKLMHKKYTQKYKVIVEGVNVQEFEFRSWETAEIKYRELIKNHQSK